MDSSHLLEEHSKGIPFFSTFPSGTGTFNWHTRIDWDTVDIVRQKNRLIVLMDDLKYIVDNKQIITVDRI